LRKQIKKEEIEKNECSFQELILGIRKLEELAAQCKSMFNLGNLEEFGYQKA
jgi:hypothetical protein